MSKRYSKQVVLLPEMLILLPEESSVLETECYDHLANVVFGNYIRKHLIMGSGYNEVML